MLRRQARRDEEEPDDDQNRGWNENQSLSWCRNVLPNVHDPTPRSPHATEMRCGKYLSVVIYALERTSRLGELVTRSLSVHALKFDLDEDEEDDDVDLTDACDDGLRCFSREPEELDELEPFEARLPVESCLTLPVLLCTAYLLG